MVLEGGSQVSHNAGIVCCMVHNENDLGEEAIRNTIGGRLHIVVLNVYTYACCNLLMLTIQS